MPPRNNLDEVIRRQKQPETPTSVVREPGPARGPRFKPASSLATPVSSKTAPTLKPRASLSSFSTPGFGKKKPIAPQTPASENQPAYVSISSTDTTPVRDLSPSIPVKRTSSDPIIEIEPPVVNKRMRVEVREAVAKENVFHHDPKGKGRELGLPESVTSPPRSKFAKALPSVQETPHSSSSLTHPNKSSAWHRVSQTFDYSDLSTLSDSDLCNEQAGLLNLRETIMEQRSLAQGQLSPFMRTIEELLKDRHNCLRAVQNARKSGDDPVLPSSPWVSRDKGTSPLQPLPPASLPSRPPAYNIESQKEDFEVTASVTQSVGLVRDAVTPQVTTDNADSDEELWEATGGVDDTLFDEPSRPRSVPCPVISNGRNDEATKTPFYSEVVRTLREVFGLEQFRPFQLEAINATLSGKDAFILFPTGGGKSLCFQLPAVCKWGKRGLTVVVSPLLSLIENQTAHLRNKGVDVITLGNSLAEVRESAQRLRPGPSLPRLMYCTPEKLEHSNMLHGILSTLYNAGQLSRFVIDEAHCISLWGMDFRSSYKNLIKLRERYPNVPIMALTATANPRTQDDVIETLKISGCVRLTQPFNRPNLWYEVRKKSNNVLQQIVAFIREKHVDHTGVIYCSSREKCEVIAKQLRDEGLSAQHYHAEIPTEEKKRIQKDWQEDRCKIIVATIAFGMGIDKPDVRFVIHHAIPTSLDGYYQESGRAGRDGEPADCLLFYVFKETLFMFKRIRDNENATPQVKEHQEDALRHMIEYCENDVDCRRVQVLNYFGQPITPEECNRHCDNCRDDRETRQQDVSQAARSAIQLASRLIASSHKPLTKTELVSKIYGQMKERGGKGTPKAKIERLVNRLFVENLLELVTYVVGMNVHGKVQVTPNGTKFVDDGRLIMTFKENLKKAKTVTANVQSASAQNRPDSTLQSKGVPLDDDPIDDDDNWEPRIAESDPGEDDSDIEVLDEPPPGITNALASNLNAEEKHCSDCFKELLGLRVKHSHLADKLKDDVLYELSLILPHDFNEFRQILQSADSGLKESDFKTKSVKEFMDCCIRYRMTLEEIREKRSLKPVSAVSVTDLHSRFSHPSKPSSSSKPISQR